MFARRYLKKFLLGAVACTGVACDVDTGKCIRRSELPIYSSVCPQQSAVEERAVEEAAPGKASAVEEKVSVVRKELWVWYDQYEGYKEKCIQAVETGKAHAGTLITSLQQEELPVPRAGAVAIGGLAGIVLGLRGGWFKRIFYGSTCAAVMAGVCYPKEFAEVSEVTLTETKKYLIIAYNFIHGVKPEGLPLPSPSKLLGEDVSKATKAAGAVAGKEAPSAEPLKSADPPNDQSNPKDKDLYSNRR